MDIFLDFILSLRWLWIIVIILGFNILKAFITLLFNYINLKREMFINTIDYSEEKIMAHLNYIIQEAIDEYIVLVFNPKNMPHMTTAEENKMIDYLSAEIPKRLSEPLLEHLSYIYSKDYIGKFIGAQIYIAVMDYKINYNIEK